MSHQLSTTQYPEDGLQQPHADAECTELTPTNTPNSPTKSPILRERVWCGRSTPPFQQCQIPEIPPPADIEEITCQWHCPDDHIDRQVEEHPGEHHPGGAESGPDPRARSCPPARRSRRPRPGMRPSIASHPKRMRFAESGSGRRGSWRGRGSGLGGSCKGLWAIGYGLWAMSYQLTTDDSRLPSNSRFVLRSALRWTPRMLRHEVAPEERRHFADQHPSFVGRVQGGSAWFLVITEKT